MLSMRKSMLDYETDVLEATAKLGYNKGEILHNALKMYLDANKDLKEKLAVELYKEGKVSLGKASEIADLSYEEMKELLIKNNVEIRRGPVSLKELKARAEELAEIL
jgi:predicted HTH domain antitoxin